MSSAIRPRHIEIIGCRLVKGGCNKCTPVSFVSVICVPIPIKLGRAGYLSLKVWQGRNEGRRVDRRHPDPSLVDLKQVCYKRIEVDICFRIIVESQLLPVPVGAISPGFATLRKHLHLELRVENFHVQMVLRNLLLTHTFRLGLVPFLLP